MFTGIIKELGAVHGLERQARMRRLAIGSEKIYNEAGAGDSVSVNGVCLTVTEKRKGILYFDVMEETVKLTGISALKENDAVNLEGALAPGDRLGGHFVLGHIDCVGKIKKVEKSSGGTSIEIEIGAEFDPLIVKKGSIAVDGVSLTIGQADRGAFTVHLIPHTLNTTTLSDKKPGDPVNIEFDIIGKYLFRFKALERPSGLTESFLKENGF